MYKVEIEWTNDMNLERAMIYEEDKDELIYMILRRWKYKNRFRYRVLYIGKAYEELFSERFKNHHKLWEIYKENYRWGKIVFRFGKIIPISGKLVNERLTNDVENALIMEMQPEYNKIGKKNYNGRDLEITNKGRYRPLPNVIDTSEWEE